MLSIDDMRQLRGAYNPYLPDTEEEVLAGLGNPSREEIVGTALEGLKSEDRNTRVLMLRVLKGQEGESAMRGILTGLSDEKRRVKLVALAGCQSFLDCSEITSRLEEMVHDEAEHRRVRVGALHCLARIGATSFMADTLSKHTHYRAGLLLGLLGLELSDEVESLLKAFVEDGTKEEAVMATRGLCGYRVISLGAFENDRATQRQIKETCEPAAGRVYYWMKRTEYQALLKERESKPQDPRG